MLFSFGRYNRWSLNSWDNAIVKAAVNPKLGKYHLAFSISKAGRELNCNLLTDYRVNLWFVIVICQEQSRRWKCQGQDSLHVFQSPGIFLLAEVGGSYTSLHENAHTTLKTPCRGTAMLPGFFSISFLITDGTPCAFWPEETLSKHFYRTTLIKASYILFLKDYRNKKYNLY